MNNTERGIIIGIALCFALLIGSAYCNAKRAQEYPCELVRPCLSWVWMNDMMQCVQHGDPEPRDAVACAARGGR